jgi:hypothetical protein
MPKNLERRAAAQRPTRQPAHTCDRSCYSATAERIGIHGEWAGEVREHGHLIWWSARQSRRGAKARALALAEAWLDEYFPQAAD